MAEIPQCPEAAPLSGSGHTRRLPGSAALAEIFRPRVGGPGYRHLILGDSGTGKTYAMQRIVAAALEAPGSRALIIDDGDPARPQFPGQCFVDAAAFRVARAANREDRPTLTSHCAIFRGEPWKRIHVDAADVGELAWELVCGDHQPLLVVVDEFARCIMPPPGEKASAWWRPWRDVLCEGRKVRLNLIAGLQEPQDLPSEAKNQTSTVQIHRLGPTCSNYLADTWHMDREWCDVISRLELGEFVLRRSGQLSWDGVIYKF